MLSIIELRRKLNRHTDSPWEGGCVDCYHGSKCFEAQLIEEVLQHRNKDS